jgi:hypothetical protein
MQARIEIIVAALLTVTGAARAQISTNDVAFVIGSMHGIAGARSSAMGEASAAALGDPSAWNTNPATLAGTNGAGAFYITGHRSIDPGSHPTDWQGAGVWLATPVVNVAFHYVKENLGEFQTFNTGGSGAVFTAYNTTSSLTLASPQFGPVAFGASIKWARDRVGALSPAIGSSSDLPPIDGHGVYADVGAIGSFRGLMSVGAHMHDSIRVGVAVQDIGDKLRYEVIGQADKLAQWLHVGAGYTLAIGDSAATTLRATVNGQYTRMLNGSSAQKRAYSEFGLEATAFEIASVRFGARFVPQRSTSSTLWTTFGVGVNLPLRKVGLDIPLALGADFARLPQGFTTEDDGADLLFELRVAYIGELFGR